jgi:hypothetical protein
MVRQRDAFALAGAGIQLGELSSSASVDISHCGTGQAHFLFNARECPSSGGSGSPASAVLGSLIDYLRAAVPPAIDDDSGLVQLVRSISN